MLPRESPFKPRQIMLQVKTESTPAFIIEWNWKIKHRQYSNWVFSKQR